MRSICRSRARRPTTRPPASRSGSAIGWFALLTGDSRKTAETLKERGVEFTQEPTEHFYGIDCGVRDPFGNHIRILQPAKVAAGTAV